MSLLALLLSLVLEHFRPLLTHPLANPIPRAPDQQARGSGNSGNGGGSDGGNGAVGRLAPEQERDLSAPDPDTRLDADLEAELARMADETPEPDPFDEPRPRSSVDSALPIDADLAARAALQDDRSAFVPLTHPWFAPTARLVDWATPEAIDTADRPPMGWSGWSVVVFAPAALLWFVQGALAGLGWLGAIAVLALHVWVLWHGVLAGRLHRRLDRLLLLADTADDADARASAEDWVLRWVDRPGALNLHVTDTRATDTRETDTRETARLALSLPVLDAYRDIFAPLFWYWLLPGATGPLLVWCARVAAARRGGVAASGLRILDWVPIRLAGFGFALGGRFDDALFGLRSSHAASSRAATIGQPGDPAADQRLMLLPAASGALGIDLLDEQTRQRLKEAAVDLAAECIEPGLDKVSVVRALLIRNAGVWATLVAVAWLMG